MPVDVIGRPSRSLELHDPPQKRLERDRGEGKEVEEEKDDREAVRGPPNGHRRTVW